MPAEFRGHIAVTPDILPLLVDAGVTTELSKRGWELVRIEENSDGTGCQAVIRLAATPINSMDWRACPAVTLGLSAVKGRFRLGVENGGAAAADTHLAHLVETLGRTLDDDDVAKALSALPLELTDYCFIAPFGHAARSNPVELSQEMRGALRQADIETDPERIGKALAVAGADPVLWGALSRGHEIVTLGSSPLATLGLSHHAATPADIPEIAGKIETSPLNHRDRARRALATEILFNSVAADDGARLASMIDACLHRIVPPPRRSVSIVVNNYNYLRYLPAAIASAQHQTVAAKEIVVVDDGSTDGSAEWIAQTAGIVPVLKTNGGQASAFNAGFARTTGDIVLFLDADDRLLPDAVAHISTTDLTDVSRLFFRLETIDRHGRPTGLYTPGTPTNPAATGYIAGAVAHHGIFPFVPTSGNAFPRRVLERLLPMPEPDWKISADLWLVLAAAGLGDTHEIPKTLGQYRVHGKNAHFDDLGSEHHAQAAHLERRETAWRSLLSNPPPGLPRAVARMLEAGLHVALSRSAVRHGRLRALRHWPGALHLAAKGRDRSARNRAAQALMPIRLALQGVPEELRGADAPFAVNLLATGGASGWPRLVPGKMYDLRHPGAPAMLLGHGWAHPDGHGARLLESTGTLAFRLPDLGCNWRLRIGFEIDGDAPVRRARLCLNKTEIDTFDLHGAGTMDLRLPHTLLVRWDALLGLGTADSPISRGATPAGCLSLSVAPDDVRRLLLTNLRLDVLSTTQVHAPSVAAARYLPLGGASPDARALLTLGSGWGWPDGRGAQLQGARGALSFSLTHGGPHALTFLWRAGPAAREMSRPAECVMVSLNDALVAGHVSPDGLQITVQLPVQAASSEGRVRIALMPFPDDETGGWPDLRLIGIRLDRLLSAGYNTPPDAPVLAPNTITAVGPLLAAIAERTVGLLADGEVARIAGVDFQLPFNLPHHDGSARLHLALSAPQEPVSAMFTLGAEHYEVLLSGDATVILAVPPDLASAPVLRGTLADPARRCTLRSVQLVLDPGASFGTSDDPARDDIELANGVGPHEISRLAATPSDWHAPLDDALWLATHRAVLVLPRLASGPARLAVTVLALAEAGQSLSIACGAHHVETDAPGPQTLHLPLDPGEDDSRLVFTSSRLIASQALGAGDVGLLGGAVLRIAIEVSGDCSDRTHPQDAPAMAETACSSNDAPEETDRR